MSGCTYQYHIDRIINCLATGTYNGTVDFDHNGVINIWDLLMCLNIMSGC